jgi:hypothetical protein
MQGALQRKLLALLQGGPHMYATFLLNELNVAIAVEFAAKADALQRGLDATKPLTATRLAELCALGEKMMYAKIAKDDAYEAAHAWAQKTKLQIVIPPQRLKALRLQ